MTLTTPHTEGKNLPNTRLTTAPCTRALSTELHTSPDPVQAPGGNGQQFWTYSVGCRTEPGLGARCPVVLD